MRRFILLSLLLLIACGKASSKREEPAHSESKTAARSAPVSDLEFNDEQLQVIAKALVKEAGLRRIDSVSGRNRLERLLALEASLGGSTLALDRANKLVRQLTSSDVTQWSKLRQRADGEFATRNDEVAARVRDMLARWQRERTEAAFDFLSSNYRPIDSGQPAWIGSYEWERRFHEFVARRPMDAATWGWLLLRDNPVVVRQQYGRADAEKAYQFYLEVSGLGTGREAQLLFSVPGIEIKAP